MGLFKGAKTAETLDSTAAALHRAGTRIAGETGGRAADALSTAVIGPIRDRNPHACTRPDCDHD